MRPILVCLSISKELRDSYQGLDDQIFREAAEMLGRKLLENGILERHLEPDINRPEFHYILILNRRDLPEPKPELKPMNIPSAGSGAMGTTPPKFKLKVKPEQPVEGLEEEYKKWWESVTGRINIEHCMEWYMHETARHFAEWGVEHLKK